MGAIGSSGVEKHFFCLQTVLDRSPPLPTTARNQGSRGAETKAPESKVVYR